MRCEFCNHETSSVIRLQVFSSKGIWVCIECYQTINRHLHKPYSKVMDKLAITEAGYRVNRKLARR